MMTNKNYISGRKFEYRVRDYFESIGYFVLRSAGSHTPVDLLAVNKKCGMIYLIQCKHGTNKISKIDIEKLFKIAQYFDASIAIVATTEKRKMKLSMISPGLNLIPTTEI